MIPALLRAALRHRWVVLALTAFIAGLGVWAFQHQQIDAYPDISSQMVQVITTIFGLSVVQMIFEERTDAYWARQRVTEKLAGLELPEGAKPELGPLATAYGEIFRYEVVSDGTREKAEADVARLHGHGLWATMEHPA